MEEVKKIFEGSPVHVVCEGKQLLRYRKTAKTLNSHTTRLFLVLNPRTCLLLLQISQVDHGFK